MELGRIGREINIGFIGLGFRGQPELELICQMEDIRIIAICDVYLDRLKKGGEIVKKAKDYVPILTQDWHEVISHKDIEAVIIMTGWQSHITIAIEAMKCGKAVGLEVGGASSIKECWDLVRTSESTGKPCMMLENCCYGKEEMTLLSMIRQGIFGELVHVQGGYQHDLRYEIGMGDINRHYRQNNFLRRNGELYPTHELGPIAKYLNLNRGNRMLSLVSMASKARGQSAWLKENRPDSPLVNAHFAQGDIVSTLIKCAGGETILLTHDCTLPRPYSRGGRVQGTKGIWQEDNRGIYIEGMSPGSGDSGMHKWESDSAYMEKHMHPLWKEYERFGMRGGHDGMDYLVLRAFFESLQDGAPMPIDVYDTASWMAITCLSEQSIAMGSMPVAVPDFTNGRWTLPREKNDTIFALD